MFIIVNVMGMYGFTERAYNVGKIVTIRHVDNMEMSKGINCELYYKDEDGAGCMASCRETFEEVTTAIGAISVGKTL